MPGRSLPSFTMLVVYLAAVAVPCEAPDPLRVGGPSAPPHAGETAAHGTAVDGVPAREVRSPTPRPPARTGSHAQASTRSAHHAPHRAQSPSHSHSHGSDAVPRPSESPGPRSASESAVGFGTDPADGAVWVATCSCGCDRTRALVGGGAARLGAAVPPAPASALPEAARVAAAETVVLPVDDVLLDEDPVPI